MVRPSRWPTSIIGALADAQSSDEGQLYHWPVVIGSVLATAAILAWFQRLPYARTPEESLQEAIEHHRPTGCRGNTVQAVLKARYVFPVSGGA